jgi:RNA polymerase sigma-70 factor, ECF subfamily
MQHNRRLLVVAQCRTGNRLRMDREQSQPASSDTAADCSSTEELAAQLYAELHHLAAACMRGQQPWITLQPTALVHEAYLRMARARPAGWQSRTHFMCTAATSMRRVLIDCARRRRAAKRGGGADVTFIEGVVLEREHPIELLALDEALNRLDGLDARAARLVELRFFGGLEVEAAAALLGVSTATAKRDWRFAKAWLGRELREGGA